MPATGHGRLGVTPANGGSAGASIAQRARQAAAPAQRHFTAMPGALRIISAPKTGAGTGLGWFPNSNRPWRARQHLDHLASSIPLTFALEWGAQGCWVPKTRVSPPPRCFPASLCIPGPGKESAAPGAGWGCLCRGRAPGVSDSRTHPRTAARQSLREQPERLYTLLKACKAGNPATSHSHSSDLGFPISHGARPQSVLIPLH